MDILIIGILSPLICILIDVMDIKDMRTPNKPKIKLSDYTIAYMISAFCLLALIVFNS